jgi:hypothetical protein
MHDKRTGSFRGTRDIFMHIVINLVQRFIADVGRFTRVSIKSLEQWPPRQQWRFCVFAITWRPKIKSARAVVITI